MTRSLRLRLIVSILALLLPASAAAGWLLVQVFASRLLRDLDVALEEEATTVAALLQKPASAEVMSALLAGVAAETDIGVGKRIAVRRGDTVVGEAPPGAAAQLAGATDLRTARAVAGPPDDRLTVVVGVPAAAALHATQRLTVLLAIGIPGGLLLIAAGLWVITGRALRPLEETSRALDAIGVGDLAVRLAGRGRDDEVGRMVAAINRMLERLAQSVAEMQRFTADAAHELRTPLAVLRTGLEVALRRDRPAAEYRAALAEALEESERLARLAEDLLTLARLEALPARAAATPIDLGEMLHELGDAWTGQVAQGDVAVDVTAPPGLVVQGRAADLYRLFGNLIDNAVHHSPRPGRITLQAAARDGAARIVVADSGAGVAAHDLPHVFERFYRAAGENVPGSGLGLSIARAIARAHGGEVALANRPGGGCAAEVVLPLAP